jgi:protein phosphatase
VKATARGTLSAFSAPPEIIACLLTDIGCLREVNEDCGRWIRPENPELLADKGSLMIVADGMGGHAAGEVASKVAVEIISRAYYESAQCHQAALTQAFHAANQAIFQAARHSRRLTGMGTTCTALVIHDHLAYSAQVGDSRLYLVRGEQIYLMSEDHSAVMEMVRRGQMTRDEARCHSDKNIILRALGTQREINVATWQSPFPLNAGDRFVLCSDGLYDLVSDEEVRRHAADNEPATACEKLIALAKERGGHDNITTGIVQLR